MRGTCPASCFLHNYKKDEGVRIFSRLDFCRSLVSGLRSSRGEACGEERGLLSRTAAGNLA